MAAIHDLIAQVADERLRDRLAAEWACATRELAPDRAQSKRYQSPRWERLQRGGDNATPDARPGLFYPIHIDPGAGRIVSVGRPLSRGERPSPTQLGDWEPGLLAEELARGDVQGWLRNLPHKPWALEIPYEAGSEVRPMFPDFVVVRKQGDDFVVDILEPHDPSRDDNVGKARGLARFAERHGARFGRIQLIRKRRSVGGAEQFVRLDINRAETIQKLLLIDKPAQLDVLFDGVH